MLNELSNFHTDLFLLCSVDLAESVWYLETPPILYYTMNCLIFYSLKYSCKMMQQPPSFIRIVIEIKRRWEMEGREEETEKCN